MSIYVDIYVDICFSMALRLSSVARHGGQRQAPALAAGAPLGLLLGGRQRGAELEGHLRRRGALQEAVERHQVHQRLAPAQYGV